MTLSAGSRIGPYEIIGSIGAGGMGEVFRARDLKLARDIAIKVLPAEFAQDSDRLARFRREAKILASLNHPGIAAIYGFEESDGVAALALELVEGEDLSTLLKRGPVPIDEAIDIALQIAQALEAAHDAGVIHRDLKPANIKRARDGRIKVLDFGLARLDAGAPTETQAGARPPNTITLDGTAAGMILGTAAYMSPEQARGLAVDHRSDIWSFGVVFFELLSGRRLFLGETISDILAAVLLGRADWESLPSETPASIRRLLERCLVRDRRNRLQAIGEARIALDEYRSNPLAISVANPSSAAVVRAPARRSVVPWVAATLGVAFGIVAAVWKTAPVSPLRKFSLVVEQLAPRLAHPVISPDGQRLAFVADGRLWVRELDRLESREMAGVEAETPFWSPDSGTLAYVFAGQLWRVALSGGDPAPIAPIAFNRGGAPGGVWTNDDQILYASASSGLGLFEVSAKGGVFREVLKAEPATELDFHQPSLLPDGRSLLFVTDLKEDGARRIEVLNGGRRKIIVEGARGDTFHFPIFSPTGHILYQRTLAPAGIWAVRYSPSRQEVEGEPFLVSAGASDPSVAGDGTLLYVPSAGSTERQLAWLDRSGTVLSRIGGIFNKPGSPRLSPDEHRVAFTAEAEASKREVYVMGLPGGAPTRLTFSPENESRAEWMPSGEELVFDASSGPGPNPPGLFAMGADGTGARRRIGDGEAPSVAPDAKSLVFALNYALWRMPLDGSGKPAPYVSVENKYFNNPTISPNGRFVAYLSFETGKPEVFLRRYPEGEAKWQVSAGGGGPPRWNRRGDRLYFADTSEARWEVEIQTSPMVSWKAPHRLFSGAALAMGTLSHDVATDGRFLAFIGTEPALRSPLTRALVVTENWFAEFKNNKRN